jgi:hypothetical protein
MYEKLAAILFWVVSAPVNAACPDFSGRWIGECRNYDGAGELSDKVSEEMDITQEGCSRVATHSRLKGAANDQIDVPATKTYSPGGERSSLHYSRLSFWDHERLRTMLSVVSAWKYESSARYYSYRIDGEMYLHGKLLIVSTPTQSSYYTVYNDSQMPSSKSLTVNTWVCTLNK